MTRILSLVVCALMLSGCYLVSDDPIYAEGDPIEGLPETFHLVLETPAHSGYGSAEMVNGFEGTFEARSGNAYRPRGNRDGTRGHRVVFTHAFSGDKRWIVAQVSPPFAAVIGDHEKYVLLHKAGDRLSILPWSQTLLADWQPGKPFTKEAKKRLMARGTGKISEHQHIVDAFHAASRFNKSYRATFRIVEGAQPEASENPTPKPKAPGSGSNWRLLDKEDPITGRTTTAAVLDPAGNVSGDGLQIFFQCKDGRLDFWLIMTGSLFKDDFPDGRADATIIDYRRNDTEVGSFVLGIGRNRSEATQPNMVIAAGFAVMQGIYQGLRQTALVTEAENFLGFFTTSSLVVLRAESTFAGDYVSRFRPRDGGAVKRHLSACLK